MEGVPKQKVMLIEEDVAKWAVYDSVSAHKEGDQSAGHLSCPLTWLGGVLFLPWALSTLQTKLLGRRTP